MSEIGKALPPTKHLKLTIRNNTVEPPTAKEVDSIESAREQKRNSVLFDSFRKEFKHAKKLLSAATSLDNVDRPFDKKYLEPKTIQRYGLFSKGKKVPNPNYVAPDWGKDLSPRDGRVISTDNHLFSELEVNYAPADLVIDLEEELALPGGVTSARLKHNNDQKPYFEYSRNGEVEKYVIRDETIDRREEFSSDTVYYQDATFIQETAIVVDRASGNLLYQVADKKYHGTEKGWYPREKESTHFRWF